MPMTPMTGDVKVGARVVYMDYADEDQTGTVVAVRDDLGAPQYYIEWDDNVDNGWYTEDVLSPLEQLDD